MGQRKFLICIFFIKAMSCVFAYFLFAKFVQLGDSQQYINATLEINIARLTDRTYLTENFYAFLALFTGRGFFIHLATSFLVAWVVFYVFAPYSRFLPYSFWFLLIMPLHAVWTSVVGKEALAFCVFLLLAKWIVDTLINNRASFIQLLACLILGLILRPHYLLAYFFIILLVYIFYHKKEVVLLPGKYMSSGIHLSFLLFSFLLFIIFLSFSYETWAPFLDYLMITSESYFLSYDGNTNRTDIHWSTPTDFISNMAWGIPASIIGPTIQETINRPLMAPFFIEGLLSFILIPYFFFKLFKLTERKRNLRFFLFICFLPAVFIALVIHYPFGIFNPGTATRYKQALTPLLYFLPILILCAVRANESKRLHVEQSKTITNRSE